MSLEVQQLDTGMAVLQGIIACNVAFIIGAVAGKIEVECLARTYCIPRTSFQQFVGSFRQRERVQNSTYLVVV